MRASRKEMNQSYVNQQNQLMSMNVVREAQRLQLSQAETIVKLNQLKDEVIKALPPKNVRVVIPTSNAALENTLEGPRELTAPLQEVVEEKKPAPTKTSAKPKTKLTPVRTKDIPNLAAQVLASAGKPSVAKANSRASSISSSRASSTKTSPTASEAHTVSTSTTAQASSPKEELNTKKHFGHEQKVLRDAIKRSKMSISDKTKSINFVNETKKVADLKAFEQVLIDGDFAFEASDLIGNGLKRNKPKSQLMRGKNGRFTK